MKNIFKFVKPYLFFVIISPLMMMGEVLADLLLPYLMSFIVNYGIIGIDILDPKKGSLTAYHLITFFQGKNFSRLDLILTFGIMMLIITLFGGFFGVFSAYTSARAAQGVGKDLRKAAYRKVMSLSMEQTDAFTTGSLVTRMTNDIALIVEFLEFLFRGMIRSPMFLIGGTIMLVLLNAKFGFIMLCIIPILGFVLFYVLKRAIPMYGIVQTKLDKINSIVQENVGGARVVKAYNKEDYEYHRFNQGNDELRNINYSVLKLMAVISPVLTILQNVAIIAIIYIGGLNVVIENSGMTTGSVMAAITYVTQAINGLMMMTNLFQMVSRATASSKRINEILETEPAIKGGSIKENQDEYKIQFEHVDFFYPGTVGRPVLNDLNFKIKKGEFVGIIGSTGCGKSSLIQLIPRFYDVTGGCVYIDGLPIKEYDLKALRQKIGYVMQKSELFSATIEENLKWGKEDASMDEIKQAADIAQATEFIDTTPEKYNTYIAEKGASLSGGQKQRVSIARALLRKPEILILDDATSALDLATEAKVRNGLNQYFKNTTVLMVAQRVASIQEADRIIVIENDGTIKNIGSHDELLVCSETYRQIYQSQMKTNLNKEAIING